MKNYQRNPLGSPRHIDNSEVFDQRVRRDYPDYQNDEYEFKKFQSGLDNLIVRDQKGQLSKVGGGDGDAEDGGPADKLPQNVQQRSQLLQKLLNRRGTEVSTSSLKTNPISMTM